MPRCLVIKNDGLGDLVLLSGVIASIGERFGGNVDLLTCHENREIAEGIEALRERIYVTRTAPKLSETAQRFGMVLARAEGSDAEVLKSLRRRRYDVAITLRRYLTENTAGIMTAVNADRKLCAWQFPTNMSPQIAAKASAGWERYEGPLEVTSELSYAKGFIESTLGGEIDATPRLNYCHRQAALPNSRKIALGIASNSWSWPSGDWVGQILATDVQRRLRAFFEIVRHVACRVTPASSGIGETLTSFLSRPGGEQERETGSYDCAHQKPHRHRRAGVTARGAMDPPIFNHAQTLHWSLSDRL